MCIGSPAAHGEFPSEANRELSAVEGCITPVGRAAQANTNKDTHTHLLYSVVVLNIWFSIRAGQSEGWV